jgi:homoaconitate hydratase
VAASAIAGKIANPAFISTSAAQDTAGSHPKFSITVNRSKPSTVTQDDSGAESTLPGFPKSIKGELLFCHADNLNTDAIYPGKYTYVDDLPTEQMAKVVMENYDPEFSNIVQKV